MWTSDFFFRLQTSSTKRSKQDKIKLITAHHEEGRGRPRHTLGESSSDDSCESTDSDYTDIDEGFYLKHSSKRGVSFIYLFQQRNYLCNNSEFCCRIYEFVAKHEDLCFYRDSCRWSLFWGRFSDQKGCCLSSKTREKNVCGGRMIEFSTEMARVAEVDRGNFVGGKGKVTGSA